MSQASTLNHRSVQGTIDRLIDDLIIWQSRKDVLSLVTQRLEPLHGIGYTGMSLIENDGVATYSHRRRDGSLVRDVHPENLNPAAAAARNSELITYSIAELPPTPPGADPTQWSQIHAYFRSLDLVDMVFLPLRSSGRRYGAIFMLSNRPNLFDDAFVAQLKALAAVVAMALEKAEAIQNADSHLASIERIHNELATSNRQLAEFAHMASSDLQDPLRRILTYSERLETSATDQLEPREQDYLKRINSACCRMQRLVADLLSFSSVHSTATLDESVDLNTVLHDVLSDLEVAIDEAGASITVDPMPEVVGNRTQLRQLFQNLVGNAIKFRKPETAPIIAVRVLEAGDEVVRIEVLDNGIGFDNKFVQRIFKPFQRLHGTTTYQGSGIGLAVCRRITERHGGTLVACSEPGNGASFVAELSAGGLR